MKRLIFIFLLLIFPLLNAQSKSDNPLLFQTWSFTGLGFLSSNYEKSKNLDKNNLSFKLKKNGKIIASWIENGCFVGDLKFKFKRTRGNWKKVSDSVIYIKFPMNVSLNGSHVISNLTQDQLTLKMFVNLNKK